MYKDQIKQKEKAALGEKDSRSDKKSKGNKISNIAKVNSSSSSNIFDLVKDTQQPPQDLVQEDQ